MKERKKEKEAGRQSGRQEEIATSKTRQTSSVLNASFKSSSWRAIREAIIAAKNSEYWMSSSLEPKTLWSVCLLALVLDHLDILVANRTGIRKLFRGNTIALSNYRRDWVNSIRASESLKALNTCCCSSSGRWKFSFGKEVGIHQWSTKLKLGQYK